MLYVNTKLVETCLIYRANTYVHIYLCTYSGCRIFIAKNHFEINKYNFFH